MKTLPPETCAAYLGILAGIKQHHRLYDVHVHPYEVLFDRFTYQDSASAPGVLSLDGKGYSTPSIYHFRFPELTDLGNDSKSIRLQDISVMLLKKVYSFVGEKVFSDQMELGGIDKVLLLPVASESSSATQFENRLRWVTEYYSDQRRFAIAGSVPGSVPTDGLRDYILSQQVRFNIKAIKCHPVVTGIDLSRMARKQWLAELVRACGQCRLPLIIHSGRNNPYWGGKRTNCAALENLKRINFSCSGTPVIIAHAGFHRCTMSDILTEGLPLLKNMLSTHDNLFVDISGLTFEPLKVVIEHLPANRILFGSDALYAPQWESVILTLHALRVKGRRIEDDFIKYASINPRSLIFEEKTNVQYAADQIPSVP
ncbi:hypothetical protein GMLC_20700 [Geomonas limicola]|uniref:Amidohydrolase-related domain-containing protein n=1 Tax=Geomonas limicola TaxID=2740186 RepID=A0A6V8N7M0_9BACT|nr:amidohydrolase family protein [Geomonas limicola]GFO68491.1 hypothetical protein GMLC_20700 [Geomonas limicola]